MIPMQTLSLKHDGGYYRKDYQRDTFLYHLELHETKRTSIIGKSDAICGYLTTIFEKSNAPGEEYHAYQWPMAAYPGLL